MGDDGADSVVTVDWLVLASDMASEAVETVELVDGALMWLGACRNDDRAQKVGIMPDYSLQGLTIMELLVQCES